MNETRPSKLTASRAARVLNPRSIAFVGASPRASVVRGMVHRLHTDGFTGAISMVNPNYEEVHGHACYPTLGVIPEPPDLAIITIRAANVPQVTIEASEAGVGAALIYSTGFADAGSDGVANVEHLREALSGIDIAVCGPGSFGYTNVHAGITPFSAGPDCAMPSGNISVVAQSGGFANIITLAALERRFGFSYLIASGSEIQLTAADYLEYIVEDPGTDVLVAMLEEIRDIICFSAFLERACELEKPVVLLPLGRSEAGQRATSAHSGALAARGDVQEAFLRRAGAIVVTSIDDLIETVVLLAAWRGGAPKRATPVIVSHSGGDCAIALDLATDIGLEVPELAPATQAALGELLPESTMLFNPVDLGTRPIGDPALIQPTIQTAASDPSINLVLTRLFGNPGVVESCTAACAAAGKPQVFFTRAALSIDPDMFDVASAAGNPILQSPDRAFAAVQQVVANAAYRTRRRSGEDKAPAPLDLGSIGLSAERFAGRLSEVEALSVLAAAGITTVPYRLADSADAAVSAAAELGYPLVVKVDSPDIEHKSEAGGVRLNIHSDEVLAATVTGVLEDVASAHPEALIRGVVLQPMLRPALELIVGLIPDERFGAAVLVGLGGLLAETLGRSQVRIAPFDTDVAMEALEQLLAPNARGMANWRGLDVAAAAKLLARFSRLAAALAPLVEAIDINPVGLFTDGGGATALDCLILPRRMPASGATP